ncbi:MAG: aldo/keto reductase [Acidobacteriota bacterium]|nr:MAG: aldo/keto reductase [Acidobacteriota bacterium]
MEYRKLGKTGLEVSALGYGAVEIGRSAVGQELVDELLNSAIDSGLNVIDTAAAYWTSEELIGNAIQGRRREVVLMTKCGSLDGFTRDDWSQQGVLDTITESLKRLKTDYLDVAQLHSCDSEVLRRGEAIEGLIRAQERGYTRFTGYSGDGDDALFAIGLDFFDTLQTSISIADQEAIELTIPKAVSGGLGIIAKRPIANAVWRNESRPENPYHRDYWDRLEDLKYPFLDLPLEESIGIALRFTLSVEGVATAIVGTTKPGRWQQNANYIDEGPLADEEIGAIRDRWRETAKGDWTGRV